MRLSLNRYPVVFALAYAALAGAPADAAPLPFPRWDGVQTFRLAQAEPPPPPPEAAPEGAEGAPTPTTPGGQLPPPPTGQPQPVPRGGGGRYLLLPEISFIGTGAGKLSNDGRDEDRDRVKMQEYEIAIQSYVYPGVFADAQIVAEGEEDLAVGVEQGYLLFEQIAPHLSGRLGKYFVSFGRTNHLHRHSWLYAHRPLVLQNFLVGESLSGEGADLAFLVPTGSKLFLQLNAGTYAGAGTEQAEEPDVASEIPGGTGAQLADKFSTARLWAAYPPTETSELEAGASWLEGKGFSRTVDDVETSPNIRVTGVDLSYRHYGKEAKRLLLRGEYLWYRDSGVGTTRGYYALADYRLSNYHEIALLYDWSGIPTLAGAHESSISGIYTRQFTEATYSQLQFTHGDRPGKQNYNEVWLKFVWGVGPHLHKLE